MSVGVVVSKWKPRTGLESSEVSGSPEQGWSRRKQAGAHNRVGGDRNPHKEKSTDQKKLKQARGHAFFYKLILKIKTKIRIFIGAKIVRQSVSVCLL